MYLLSIKNYTNQYVLLIASEPKLLFVLGKTSEDKLISKKPGKNFSPRGGQLQQMIFCWSRAKRFLQFNSNCVSECVGGILCLCHFTIKKINVFNERRLAGETFSIQKDWAQYCKSWFSICQTVFQYSLVMQPIWPHHKNPLPSLTKGNIGVWV